MKKAGKLTYAIASAIQLVLSAIGIILAIIVIVGLAATLSSDVAIGLSFIVAILMVVLSIIFIIPTLLIVIFGFKKSEKLHFVGAILAIIIGGYTLVTALLGDNLILGSFSFAIAIAQLTGGILYLVGRNK